MAFLICYSDSIADYAGDRAVYLDQAFYRLIFRNCRNESSGFVVLREIALLRYKSPPILISNEQIAVLINELDMLTNANREHPQIDELRIVCDNAVQKRKNLTVSGDMHPELDNSLVSRIFNG